MAAVGDATSAAPPAVAPVFGGSTFQASLRAVYIIWYRDVLRYFRDRFRLIASLTQPLLYLVIFGTGLGSALGQGGGGTPFARAGVSYSQFLLGGVIGMTVLFTAIFSGMSIVWDREFGFLKEILVAPISRLAVGLGKTLGGATQAMIQGCIILLLAPLVGVSLTPLKVVELVPLIALEAFALTGLGVAVAARMRSMQGFQAVMNFLMMPLFFLSGGLFPLTSLPAWMDFLTHLDPLAYGVDPIRKVLLYGAGVPNKLVDKLGVQLNGGPMPIGVEALLTAVFGVIMLFLAIASFRARD
jgi:ABC-2 type transport system permease protein